MSTVYRHYVSDRVSDTGLVFWIDTGVLEQIGDKPYIRLGKSLFENTDGWRDSKPAVLEAIAAEITAKSELLSAQAAEMRRQAEAIRATASEVTA